MNFVRRLDNKGVVMQEGDLVIVFTRHDSMDHIVLRHNAIHDNRYGAFHHNDFIGKPFGSKIKSRCSDGFIYALEPTPECWNLALKHRTQIVHDLDASIVNFYLDLKPGSIVVESGTGSGAMSVGLCRALAPTGHLYTFEFNESRANIARDEFGVLGLSSLVTVTHRDVCGKDGQGGGFADIVGYEGADAVFLDLPEPWLAVKHAKDVLKPGKALCSYSPCMEQVMKTCEVLRAEGFYGVQMLEVRHRPHDVKVIDFQCPDLGIPTPAPVVTSSLPLSGRASAGDAASSNSDASDDQQQAEDEEEAANKEQEEDADEADMKKRMAEKRKQVPGAGADTKRPRGDHYASQMVARLASTIRGHTAFLTFAVKSPTSGRTSSGVGSDGSRRQQQEEEKKEK